jgi:hypothetical protein
MDKPLQREPKKPYASPKLTIYGTVQELTKSVGIRGNRDGGAFPRFRTGHF